VVSLSAVKNLFVVGKNETLRDVYPERSDGLRVARRSFVRGSKRFRKEKRRVNREQGARFLPL